jgi:HPt (histidine-containing phosphotransfer) domain-containing protein
MCIAAGMDDYVSKPIQVDALVAALKRSRPAARVTGPNALATDQGEHAVTSAETAPSPVGVRDLDTAGGAVLGGAAFDRLVETAGGDASFVVEMIDSYLATTPPLLQKLRQSVANGDAAGVRLAAHTLKSGSADMGAMTLSKISAELEAMGKAGTLDGAEELVARAETEYGRVRAALVAARAA